MSSAVRGLLDQVRKLPEQQQRRVSCLLGAAVADAAARPLHWIYDLGELNAAIKKDPDPQKGSHKYSFPVFRALSSTPVSSMHAAARVSLITPHLT